MKARARNLPVMTQAFSKPGSDGRGEIPLLLESNGFLRNLLVGLLRDAGARDVMVAKHGVTALSHIAERKPSVIIADWHAHADPEEDRLKLVRKIRESANAPFRDTPVVLISQPRSRREIENARDAGVSEFLVTPIAPVTLYDRLSSLERQPRDFICPSRFHRPARPRPDPRVSGPASKPL
uniref:response regulator n=1 Tax=uncultured Maricaulis sp. TaxID=174710 RepID=UPI0030DC3098